MRMDDDLSFTGSVGTSRGSSSSRSFNNGFSIDWDEIDSIAEESLSVASSVSSGHRKRKTASRRRNNASAHLEALESGSLSRPHRSIGSDSRGSGSGSNGNGRGCISPSSPLPSSPSSRLNTRKVTGTNYGKVFFNVKKAAIFGGVASVLFLFIHKVGSFLTGDIVHHGISLGLGDRQIRRMLSQSTSKYRERHWPFSVRDELDSFELVQHPANDEIRLSLPRFFVSKDDGAMQTLDISTGLTKKVASMVGKTTVDGSKDFSVRTIFVGIPSYRDSQCRYTVESIFARAKYPERIRVGVVDQIQAGLDQSCDLPIMPCSERPDQALCRRRNQIDVYEMESTLAVGPTLARHIVNRLYRGEFYSLQTDAHTLFAKDWDVDIVEQFENTGNEMAVLTTYLETAQNNLDDNGTQLKDSRLVVCNSAYEGSGRDRRLRHNMQQQPDILPSVKGMPQLQPYWASDFSFSRGHFVLVVPYDPYLPMVQKDDEEISMALRAFTHGYDFYTPERSVAFDSSYFDEDSKKSFLQHKNMYKGSEQTSLLRLYGIIGLDAARAASEWTHDQDEMFGIGQARPLVKFFNSFGVHPREKITERKLCNFVSTGRMHHLFHESLRSDGMGLDYDNIHFRFHELQNNHEGGT